MTPEEQGAPPIRTVGVVGCGLMGSGIAEVCARNGLTVLVTEASREALRAGRLRIDASLNRALGRGKIDGETHQSTLERLTYTANLGDLAEVDLAIEAVAAA